MASILGRFAPPSAPYRARVLVANVTTAHAAAHSHPTVRRLPVKAKPSGWRSAPLLSAPRQP
jgi:hypothetical protein